jgi:hypothetical protein
MGGAQSLAHFVALLAEFCVAFMAGFPCARSDGTTLILGELCRGGFSRAAGRIAPRRQQSRVADM